MIFTKAMAKQLAPKGIRVNAVAPGPVWTPLQPSGGQPPDKLASFGADTPMGRPGQPAELAGIYVLLASPESSYSTGQVFGAAGGAGGP
jgi:NAD(P)-dependent dehydrogenase (short-subunit alcohol dehydrogenase family)